MDYVIGDTIGKYTICRELGRGQFGAVYLVEWSNSKGEKRQGALKMLTRDPSIREILEEVSTWARVSHHPNILTFIGATEYNKQILLISEWAPGGSLEGWIRAHAGMKAAIEEAVRLMLEILGGLEHLHHNGIVHRDIKPANILLKDDVPLLGDFGLARGLDLVQSSILGGTLAYMSPELVNLYLSRAMGGQAIYQRTEADDQWAAAVTFHQMLAGDLPFKTVSDIVGGDATPLPEHLPQELRDLVAKALHKESARRYQTARELRTALGNAWTGFKQRVERKTLEDQIRPEQEWSCGEAEQNQLLQQVEQRRYTAGLARQGEALSVGLLDEAKFDRRPEVINSTKQLRQSENAVVGGVKKTRQRLSWFRFGALTVLALLIGSGILWSVVWYRRTTASERINRSKVLLATGKTCAEKRDYDCAIDNFTEVLALTQDAEIYNSRGEAYSNKGNYDEAIRDYSKAIELRPGFALAHRNRGIAYHNKSNYDQAIKDYEKTIELNPQDADAYNYRGNAYFGKSDYDQAVRDCSKAIELKPEFALAYRNRGNAYYSKGDYDLTIKDCSKAIELSPQYADAYSIRGTAYLGKLDYAHAIEDYTKAIELDPQSGYYRNRGAAYNNKSDHDQAIRDYNKTIELNSQDAEAYNYRGDAYFGKSDYDQAIRDYSKAIELKPGFAFAYRNRGNAYYRKSDYDLTIKDCSKAIELSPQYADAYSIRGTAYLGKLDYTHAIENYTKAIELAPQVALTYSNRATTYEKLGEKQKATADRQKFDELSKRN